jgi:hypothetical protein
LASNCSSALGAVARSRASSSGVNDGGAPVSSLESGRQVRVHVRATDGLVEAQQQHHSALGGATAAVPGRLEQLHRGRHEPERERLLQATSADRGRPVSTVTSYVVAYGSGCFGPG